jgi:hypothetical protein
MPQVVPAHDGKQALCRNHFLRSAQCMLQHGTSPDEVHILFRKSRAPQFLDKRTEAISLPRRQYDSATRWNSSFKRIFEEHFGKRIEQLSSQKTESIDPSGNRRNALSVGISHNPLKTFCVTGGATMCSK